MLRIGVDPAEGTQPSSVRSHDMHRWQRPSDDRDVPPVRRPGDGSRVERALESPALGAVAPDAKGVRGPASVKASVDEEASARRPGRPLGSARDRVRAAPIAAREDEIEAIAGLTTGDNQAGAGIRETRGRPRRLDHPRCQSPALSANDIRRPDLLDLADRPGAAEALRVRDLSAVQRPGRRFAEVVAPRVRRDAAALRAVRIADIDRPGPAVVGRVVRQPGAVRRTAEVLLRVGCLRQPAEIRPFDRDRVDVRVGLGARPCNA